MSRPERTSTSAPAGPVPCDGRPAWAAIAAVSSTAVAIAALSCAVPARRGIGVVAALAILWPTLTQLAALVANRRAPGVGAPANDAPAAELDPVPHRSSRPAGSSPTIGIVVRVGSEPLEVSRSTILMNLASSRPVVVTSAEPLDPMLDRLGVPRIVEPDPLRAIARGARQLGTDAVAVVSGRSVVDDDGLDAAAGLLADGAAWVVGRVEPIGAGVVVHDPGREISESLRTSVRALGGVLWETDATVVRTALLPDPDGPWAASTATLGGWLRRTDAGGAETGALLARRSEPVDPGSYWPDAAARHRLRVRDALGATLRGPLRARLVAAGLATYELSIVPALAWLAAPAWIGADGIFPFDVHPIVAVGAIAATVVLRWLGLRRATGVPLRPGRDLTAAAYRLPGSLRALLPARRRSTPTRTSNPLAWGGLVCTILCGWALLELPAAQRPTVTVGISAVLLAALWYVAVLGLSQGTWSRTVFRLPVRFEATVDGVAARVVNASPGGFALQPAPRMATGRLVSVRIVLPDGAELPCTARVVSRRGEGADSRAGVSVSWTDQGRERWLGALAGCLDAEPAVAPAAPDHDVGEVSSDSTDPDDERQLAERILRRAVAIVAITTMCVTTAVVAGVQPAVIRSPSMVPTYPVGTVVLSSRVPAGELRNGDVAQVPNPIADLEAGEWLTHRVEAVVDLGDGLVEVHTRGDNNRVGETTVLPADEAVGRVWGSIPWIGRPLVWIRGHWIAVVLLLAATFVVSTATVAFRRRTRR